MEQNRILMDCPQLIGVKAVVYLLQRYQISFTGNIAGRCPYNNDQDEIDRAGEDIL